jgi:hypothetical protein
MTALARSDEAKGTNSRSGTKHPATDRRLNGTMQRYRGVAASVVRPMILVVVSILLIFVILPAALGAQAGSIH